MAGHSTRKPNYIRGFRTPARRGEAPAPLGFLAAQLSRLKYGYGFLAVALLMGVFTWTFLGPQARVSGTAPSATAIVGQASVIDGDTLEIYGQRIRLHGIDAPERAQTCQDGNGIDYRCGEKAARALAVKIGQQRVSCARKDVDRYGRVVAVCEAGGEDLNRWLVSEGLAVAYSRYSVRYVPAEAAARLAGRGIWAGRFTPPETWRRERG